MKETKLLRVRSVAALCAVVVCFCFVAHVRAQDVEDIIAQFDSSCAPVAAVAVFAPAPTEGGAAQNFGNPSQYAPQNLKQVFNPKWMPPMLPGWGPYGSTSFYPIHNAPGWSSNHYEIGSGDVIIAVNDRRVTRYSELQKAMNKSGEVVALTVVDPSNNGVYCIALTVKNHNLPLVGTDNFLSKKNNSSLGVIVWGCLPGFEGHVYKATCPFPVN